MRFHGVLIDHRKCESLVDDRIGLGEGLIGIALDEALAMANIAAKDFTNTSDIMKLAGARLSLVQQRCAFGPRAIDIADTG